MTVATGVKRLGLAIIAAFVAGAGALGLASLLISADTARDSVTAEIRAVTGFEPVLRGPVAVSLFPTGTVVFSDVGLGDANGNSPLSAERLIARLRTLPLLAGRIEISELTIERPRVAVDIDRDGVSNWSPLLAALARASGPSRSGRGTAFSQVNVKTGTITVRDALHGVTETLSSLDLALALPAGGKSFNATGRFDWRGEEVQGAVTIGDFAAALTGNVSPLKVRLAGAPMKVAFDGSMSSSPSLKVDGSLAVNAPSLRDAMRWAGDKPLPGGGFGPFSLTAKANVVGGNLALSSVNLELDGNAAEGVLSYASAGRRTWQGTLAADSLDLTPYVSTARLRSGDHRDWDRMPIVLDGLSGFDLDLRLSAARVTIGNAKLGRTAVAANLRGGRLVVTVGESQAFNGVVTGSVTLARAAAGADFKAQMQFANVDLDTCLGELFNFRRLEGKGHISVGIEGTGQSVLALTHTLNGSAEITARQGAVVGVNIEQPLRRLERRPLSGSSDFRSGRTPYERLTVTLQVSEGIVAVEDINIEGPAVRVAMAGTASIPARELDLKGTASLMNGASEAAFVLPFAIQGPWDEPFFLPDAQSLIRRSGATAPLLDALRDKKNLDRVRSAIERLQGVRATPEPTPAAGTTR